MERHGIVVLLVSFFFLSNVIKADKKINAQIQHKDHNRPTLEVDHSFCKVKNLLSHLNEVIYYQVIPSFWKSKLLYYSPLQILADFGAHYFVKCRHSSNRPVYFRVSPSYFLVRLLNDMRSLKGFSALFSLSPDTWVASASLFFIQI